MILPRRRPRLSILGPLRTRRERSRGQALVELALILPVLMLLLVAGGDLARVFAAQMTVTSAARAGALEASQHPSSFVSGAPCDRQLNSVMCAVLTESRGGAITINTADVRLACVPSPCAAAIGNQVNVTVVGHIQLLTPILAPFFGGQTLTTTSTASAQLAVKPNIVAASPSPTPTDTPTPAPTPVPTPTATPGPSPGPTPTPTPTPTPSPTPTPTPYCPPPQASFLGSTDGQTWTTSISGRKQGLFYFEDTSTSTPGCAVTGWSWNFGDGAGQASTSSIQSPTHQFSHQGSYLVTLVASNAGGAATATRTVTVTP